MYSHASDGVVENDFSDSVHQLHTGRRVFFKNVAPPNNPCILQKATDYAIISVVLKAYITATLNFK